MKIEEIRYQLESIRSHDLNASQAQALFYAQQELDQCQRLLERTRWIPVSERLPTEQDANSKGKIVAWCTSFNGTEVELNWRLVEKDGVITHWRIGIEPPEQEV